MNTREMVSSIVAALKIHRRPADRAVVTPAGATGLIVALATSTLTACFSIPQDPHYPGPLPRPPAIEEYYSVGRSYTGHTESLLKEEDDYTTKRILVQSDAGEIKIDFYQQRRPTDSLILVFPLLGGRNIVVDYLAEYYVSHGIDAAIVFRNDDFKKPENVDRLEELFHDNVVRDRIALDFFEQVYAKKQFGSMGISRGALNAAITAGADARLKYNVLVMGATDLPSIFRDSDQRRIKSYIKDNSEKKGVDKDTFIEYLRATVRTDPKYLVPFIDARHTLLMLAMFDQTVPYKYGRRMRKEMGYPRTILVPAGHYSMAAYTQFIKLLLPFDEVCLFPLDFIESESLEFYRESFGIDEWSLRLGIMRVLQAPFDAIGGIIETIF